MQPEIKSAPTSEGIDYRSMLKFTRAQLQPPTGDFHLRQDVFSLDNGGEVTISWPVPLTDEMVTDIKDWLKIVERKISRSVEKPGEQEATQ